MLLLQPLRYYSGDGCRLCMEVAQKLYEPVQTEDDKRVSQLHSQG